MRGPSGVPDRGREAAQERGGDAGGHEAVRELDEERGPRCGGGEQEAGERGRNLKKLAIEPFERFRKISKNSISVFS